MPQASPVPAELLASSTAEEAAELPPLERDHVQKVYDAVATQWHGTRYKAWPRVVEFIARLPARSLIADLGCGNGKMAPPCRDHGHHAVGCDFSIELVRIAALQQGLEAQAADVMAVPYRSATFDAALSIAVLHHVSTPERRVLLVSETLRVLRPGGVALFYAWAAEQDAGGRSGHRFDSSDVFVAFHNRLPKERKQPMPGAPAGRERHEDGGGSEGGGGGGGDGGGGGGGGAEHSGGSSGGACSAHDIVRSGSEDGSGGSEARSGRGGGDATDAVAAQEAMGGVFDASKRSVVFQRFCHVYREGELRAIVLAAGGADIVEEYYDTGNWCLVARKHSGPGDTMDGVPHRRPHSSPPPVAAAQPAAPTGSQPAPPAAAAPPQKEKQPSVEAPTTAAPSAVAAQASLPALMPTAEWWEEPWVKMAAAGALAVAAVVVLARARRRP